MIPTVVKLWRDIDVEIDMIKDRREVKKIRRIVPHHFSEVELFDGDILHVMTNEHFEKYIKEPGRKFKMTDGTIYCGIYEVKE